MTEVDLNRQSTGEKPITNNAQLKERNENMKTNIKFFGDDFIKAISAGVYEIIVSIDERSKVYILVNLYGLQYVAQHIYID